VIIVEPAATGTITANATTTGQETDPVAGNTNATLNVTVNNAHGCTQLGGTGDDTINGTSGNDVICSFSGNDTINGGGGDDIIYGGSGTDAIDGGNGNDTIYAGDGGSVVVGGNGNDMLIGGCGCRKPHPCCSGGVLVFMEEAAESVVSADA
jgi:Ca2+-binding RTX toxin-like protein